MEERYEIREKIGQGGMGSVFRAYDTRMNREVAIKRIRQEGDRAAQQESEQIVKEAGALASLQHPHIVTVYDVGADEEGPYVVMELISGKTLDELIDRAPLTWPDFRELALQTQEALIAAQELGLVHRDLKPSNLMLTWLPSGKFQVKIVDFGLAKLVQTATLEHLDEADSVLGSIFFMCPEQFERATLDARGDMYSIGCVYYHALAGIYPFNGDTGMQVMTAHLHHQVTPLQEVRPDIPRWACDWVMWHINRLASDRPENARVSLKVFLQNDSAPTQVMSNEPTPAVPESPRRPRLIIPGATAQTAAETPTPARPAPVPTSAIPEPPRTQTAPQTLAPPAGSKPSIHASPYPEPTPAPAAPPSPPAVTLRPAAVVRSARLAPATQPAPGAATPSAQPFTYKKPAMSNGIKVAIAVVLALLVVLLVMAIVGKMSANKDQDTYNRLVKLAAEEDAKDIPLGQKKVPVTKDELAVLLNAAVDVGANQARVTVLHALWWANATDGTNVDAAITEFATKRMMADDIRVSLIRDVLSKRKNPAVVPVLMEFCRSTNDTNAAIAAIQACRFMASDTEFPKYLDIVGFNPNPNIRQAAEENVVEILRKSPNREALGSNIATSLANATTDEAKYSLTRLLGPAGGPKAAAIIKKALTSADKKEQLAAAVALGTWADDAMFNTLMEYLGPLSDEQLRPRVFDAGFRFLTLPDRKRSTEANEDFWKLLARNAKVRAEQEKVIRGLANNETDEWAVSIIEYFVAESKDDNVIDLAEKALDRMRERARLKEGDKPDEKPDEKPGGNTDEKSDEKPDADAQQE